MTKKSPVTFSAFVPMFSPFIAQDTQRAWTAVATSKSKGDRKEIQVAASTKDEARERAEDIIAGWGGDWTLFTVG